MKLATIRLNDKEIASVLLGSELVPMNRLNEVSGKSWSLNLLDILQKNQLDEIKDWLKYQDEEMLEDMKKASINIKKANYGPLYRHPKRIWGIGLNYVEHASDLSEKAPTTEPASFMKGETTIIGHGDEIKIPKQSLRTTGEGELGVIIKKKCKDVEKGDWLDVVAGFTTIIDMTAEDILKKNPRYLTLSKNFDTFFSFGPLLITPDEIADVNSLSVATMINGKVHAKNKVSNMTFPPDFLVSFHTSVMTMLPGDIISTGTPRATPLAHGDVVGCNIDGFIPLENPVIDLKKT